MAVIVGLAPTAWGQTAYWLPSMETTPTEKIYRYGTKLPDDFGRALAEHGQVVTREVEGEQRRFVEVSLDWDTGGSANPADRGKVSIHKGDGWGAEWLPDYPTLRDNPAVVKALDAAVSSEHETWRFADLLVLIVEGDENPNLTLRVPIPEAGQIKARMQDIAETTVPGKFFPNQVQIPENLEEMRKEMLALGNLGRRDPNFRQKSQYANDLTGETATGMGGPNKIFRNNPQPPYFDDLGLHPKLNRAAQFMAEYYAKTDGNARMPGDRKHDAPGEKWEGAKMDALGDRLDHFAPGVGTAGEGLAGPGAADIAPETWMRSETHYRPWFNLGADVKSMGLGAARTDKGWYFCKIGGTELPEGEVELAAQTPAPATTSEPPPASGNPDSSGFPISGGESLTPGDKIVSKSGSKALVFNPDGNLVVVENPDDRFVWGLNLLNGVPFTQGKQVRMTKEGKLELLDAAGKPIWSVPAAAAVPGSVLDLTDNGILQILKPDGSVAWASADVSNLPIAGGRELKQLDRAISVSGNHTLVFNPDGNVVVAKNPSLEFVWGLNLLEGVPFAHGKGLQMTESGSFTLFDGEGAVVWSVPKENPTPGSTLDLTADGVLQVVRPDGSVAWESNGDF